MSNKENDPIEDKFKSLLNLQDSEPDEQTWDIILDGINKKEKKRKRLLIWFFSIGMIIMVAGIILNNDKILYSDTAQSFQPKYNNPHNFKDSISKQEEFINTPLDSTQYLITNESQIHIQSNPSTLTQDHNESDLMNHHTPADLHKNPIITENLNTETDSYTNDPRYSELLSIDSPFASNILINIQSIDLVPKYALRTDSSAGIIKNILVNPVVHKNSDSFSKHLRLGVFLEPFIQKTYYRGNSEIVNYRSKQDRLGLGYATNMALQYRFHRNFSASMGIGLSSYSFNSSNKQVNIQKLLTDSIKAMSYNWSVFYFKQYKIDTNYNNVAVKNKFRSIIIPIDFQYTSKLSKQINFSILSGLVYNRSIITGYKFDYNAFGINIPQSRSTQIHSNLLQIQFGFGIEYKINKHLNLWCAPKYSTFIGRFTDNESIYERPYYYGLQIGCYYTLSKK